MQIMPPGAASTLQPPLTANGNDRNPSLARPAAPPARGGTPAATPPELPATAAAAAEEATISAVARLREHLPETPPGRVYAEIWKDDVKVAQVDIHGQVESLGGIVANGGSALAGPLLAAQRAVQVAQQTGGEIRSAGQPVDGRTLLMRARLNSAYAI